MPTVQEKRTNRAKLVADARKVHDAATAEKRTMNAEETPRFNKLMDDADLLAKEIEAEEASERSAKRLEDAEKDLQSTNGRRSTESNPGAARGAPAGTTTGTEGDDDMAEGRSLRWTAPNGQRRQIEFSGARATSQYRSAYNRYLRNGRGNLTPTEVEALSRRSEERALAADDDTTGGFLVAPLQMQATLIKFVDDLVFCRKNATCITVTGSQGLGAPSLDTDPADSDWTAEIKTGSEDSSMKFGRRELYPQPLAKRIKISRKLLRLASMGAEALVRERLAYKFAITQEKAFLLGNGVNQPLGVFTPSANGISTGQDISTSMTSTGITADGLIEAKYKLKANYWTRARWLFHRFAMKQIALLKDGEGQYLWSPGLKGGQPDQLLNLPFDMSEYAPSTFTTGQYVGILGDWNSYWIADALTLEIQRLDELYAETNQVGFIGRMETDGMPVLEEAFVRLKLA
jgi:HK97 family phage major capsid protein